MLTFQPKGQIFFDQREIYHYDVSLDAFVQNSPKSKRNKIRPNKLFIYICRKQIAGPINNGVTLPHLVYTKVYVRRNINGFVYLMYIVCHLT